MKQTLLIRVRTSQGGAMVLRELGIYRLPNGRELIVIRNGLLYGSVSCERFEMGKFRVNEAERLLCQGKLTAWDISNLSDTGRTSMDIPGPLEERMPQSEIRG